MNVHAGIGPDHAGMGLKWNYPALLVGNVPVTARVLTGSHGRVDPVADAEGVTHKALVRVGAATMLERVMAALREAGVQRVLVSADAPAAIALAHAAGAAAIPPGAGRSESVARATEAAGPPLPVTAAQHAL